MFLLIIASNTVGYTFRVLLSVRAVLLWGNIAIGISDCFLWGIGIDY